MIDTLTIHRKLRVIDKPIDEDFRNMLDEAQEWAKEAGYVEEDVSDIIKSVRRKKSA